MDSELDSCGRVRAFITEGFDEEPRILRQRCFREVRLSLNHSWEKHWLCEIAIPGFEMFTIYCGRDDQGEPGLWVFDQLDRVAQKLGDTYCLQPEDLKQLKMNYELQNVDLS